MLLLLSALLAATPAPAPAAAGLACITMNTEGLPLAKRVSRLDSLSFSVGKAEVKVCYGRPVLKGRTMIGGEAVPYGKLWRFGANEPTMIHTTGTIMLGNVTIPAGSYSLYAVPGETSWELIVNKSITQWGHESQYTDKVKAQEVGRTPVKVEKLAAPVETLTFSVTPDAKNASGLVMTWQNSKVTIPLMPM